MQLRSNEKRILVSSRLSSKASYSLLLRVVFVSSLCLIEWEYDFYQQIVLLIYTSVVPLFGTTLVVTANFVSSTHAIFLLFRIDALYWSSASAERMQIRHQRRFAHSHAAAVSSWIRRILLQSLLTSLYFLPRHVTSRHDTFCTLRYVTSRCGIQWYVTPRHVTQRHSLLQVLDFDCISYYGQK